MQEEVRTWFIGQAADFYDSGDTEAGLDNAGDYVEK
jgi:hypothetical protein